MSGITFIAIDWGGRSFRAWALDEAGKAIAARKGPDGLKTVADGKFSEVIEKHCGEWLAAAPEAPVLMKGMIGSRSGWLEAAYASCPVRFSDLHMQAARFEALGRRMVILPGATCADMAGGNDVMRGEEVQIFGAAALTGRVEATICIPGTHSKWARLQDDVLTAFHTYVTGELYQLLLGNSLVGALAQGETHNDTAFRRGLDRGAAFPLSHAIFAARASTLTKNLKPDEVASFLSGTLIGAECAAQKVTDGVLLMASGVLADRYSAALTHFGTRFDMVDAGAATLAGFSRFVQELSRQRVPA